MGLQECGEGVGLQGVVRGSGSRREVRGSRREVRGSKSVVRGWDSKSVVRGVVRGRAHGCGYILQC